MSAQLEMEIALPLERFTLQVAWRSERPSLGIFGHSGAGKTSLLEALAGLRRVRSGRIRAGERVWLDTRRGLDEAPERRGVGYVPQDGLLFPHKDVMGNVLFGAGRVPHDGPALAVEKVMAVLELEPLRRQGTASLSGGERQRVALARALCSAPRWLLLDEPLGGLDAPLRRRILPYLLAVRREFGIPTVHVSHDATEVQMLCDEVLVLEQGKVLACGPPAETLTRPEVFALARSEGFENVLRGMVSTVDAGIAQVALSGEAAMPAIAVPAGGLAPGRRVLVTIRAEDIILSTSRPSGLSALNVLPARVKGIRDAEGAVALSAELAPGGPPVIATLTRQAVSRLGLAPGAEVFLIFKAQACRVTLA
jgi:molybdate transport system ATP-binding protein